MAKTARTTPAQPVTRLLYCHECKRVRTAERDPDRAAPWCCRHCGDSIRCDECGADWSAEHEREAHPA